MIPYREAPETDYERAERLEKKYDALDANQTALLAGIAISVFAVVTIGSFAMGLARRANEAESRATLAEHDAKFYEEASRLFSQQRNGCYVARDNAEHQRDIVVNAELRRQSMAPEDVTYRFVDAGLEVGRVVYRWSAETRDWRP